MKKLVIFYSYGGNTRSVAKTIAAKLKADLVEIQTVKTYPDDYDVLVSLGKKEVESGYMPQLQPLGIDWKRYDSIILGTPVWWYTYAPAVRTFLSGVNWKGKKVYPFVTNGGWLGHTTGDLKKALSGAEIAPVLNVKFDENTCKTPDSVIDEWVENTVCKSMREQISYHCFLPTRVLFGCGKLGELHRQKLPGKKALLVISNGKSARESGALERTQRELGLAGVSSVLFDKVCANPIKSIVEEGARLAARSGCDFVVALGGGSVLDAAKVMAMFAHQPGDLWDYVAGATGKKKPLVNPPLPLVAITTTAGTGSEVDSCGVITNPATHEKIGVGGYDSLFPVLAVVDPELMKNVPPLYTAFQGFDALFHSTEGFLSKASNLMADTVELSAIENIGKFLARAVRDGSDMEAREHVAFANTMSGYSMELSSCISEHSLEHAMSAYHPQLPHGAGLIMISKAYYTYFIERGICAERFVRMAKVLGYANAKEPMDFVRALKRLQRECGVADLKMSDYGISPDEFEEMATNARAAMGKLFEFDPCELPHEACVEIYRNSYK